MSQASRVANYKQQYPINKILNKSLPKSISLQDETDCFTALADLTIPDGILAGLGLSLSGGNVLVAPGQWKIDGINYATLVTNALPVDAQDATYERYDVLYVDDNNQVQLVSGELALTPFEPAIPDGTIKIGSILITTTNTTIIPPTITDYVNTTSAQNVGGVKNFTDGIKVITMPLHDSSKAAASTEWVQNELNSLAYVFDGTTIGGVGTDADKIRVLNPVATQTGQAGKFLTTDGTTTSWATVATGGGTWGSITGTLSSQTDLNTALTARELLINKATDFSVLNNTLYPTTQAVNNFVELVPTILTGMVTTTSGTTATTASGTYRLNNITYSIGSTNTTIPAQDATLNQYSLLYISTAGTIAIANSGLFADPAVPTLPSGAVLVAIIFIQPGTVTVTGGGKKGTGTVTSVTSLNTDILVTTPTTTPVLKLNKINGIVLSFFDPTSSIQTQLNSKLSTASNGLTVDGTNILLGGDIDSNTNITLPNNVSTTLLNINDASGTGAISFQADNAGSAVTLSSADIDFNYNSSINLRYGNFHIEADDIHGNAFSLDYNSNPGSGLIITDNINGKGASYFDDYSSANTSNSRWIPDKAYVDTKTVTASNGLTLSSGNVVLGGALTGLTTITPGAFQLNIGTNATGTANIGVNTGTGGQVTLTSKNISTNAVSQFVASNNSAQMNWANGSGGTSSMIFGATSMVVSDSVNSKGLIYNNDYSANFTARSLIDKGYADAHYGTGSGTVTTVSVTTANGFSGTVATATTTPAIALTLQNASGSQAGQLTSTDWTTFNNKLSTSTAASTYVPYSGATTDLALGVHNISAAQATFFAITQVNSNIAVSGSTQAALTIQAAITSGSGATGQNCGVFSGVTTGAGVANTDQTDGYISALYHSNNGNVNIHKGAELGGFFLSGTSSINTAYGIDILGQLSTGGTISTLAGIHIANNLQTNVTTGYAIFSESTFQSLFSGPVTIGNTSATVVLTPSLTIGGYNFTSSSSQIGNYGFQIFNSNANQTGNARPYALTNAYNGTTFALLIGTAATTVPTLDSAGAISTGTVGFTVDRSGAFAIPGLNTTGIVHNSSAGVLSTSLIINADITAGTIAASKLVGTDITTVGTLSAGSIPYSLLTGTPSTSIFNKVTITAPATSSTLTIVDGKTFTVNNTITLAGTDAQTYTFPSTSATIARTDAANTFTGHQTIEGVTSTGSTGTGKFVFDTAPTLSSIVLNGSGANSLYIGTANGITHQTNAVFALISGSNNNSTRVVINGASNSITAGDNYATLLVGPSPVTIPSGTSAMIANFAVATPNITNSGTITNAVTAYFAAAPSVGTNKYTAYFDTGTVATIAGTSTKVITIGGKIKEYFTDAGNTTTTETDLYSYTTEANILSANGASIQAEYGGIFVSSATATREIKVYFGGTVIYDSGALSVTTSSQWIVYASITRVSSTVIRYMVSIVVDGVTLTSPCSAGEVTGLTLSNTNILKITGQAASTGAATNDIVGKLGAVYYWPVSV